MLRLIDIAEAVRHARRAQKMTQATLARKAGVSRSRVEAFETGNVRDMNFSNLLSIMNVVGLDLRVAPYNRQRPTLDDLRAELGEEDEINAPGMGL